MGLISARIDDEDERILRKAGVNMSQVLRHAAHEEAQRVLARKALEELKRSRSMAHGPPSQDVVRGDRDAH